MKRKNASQSYAYGLIAIVGAVALVAIALILKAQGTFTLGSGNLGGAASSVIETQYYGHAVQSAGDGDALDSVGTDYIKVVSIDYSFATVEAPDGTEATLFPGETAVLTQRTITLIGINRDGTLGEFVVDTPALACGVASEQTPTCRGASACCDGACVALPDCTGELNGPIFSCGEREFYCCDERISGVNCGTQAGLDCVLTSDCPQGEVCDFGVCVEGTVCTTNADCPQGQICSSSVCVPGTTGGGGSNS